MGKASSNWSARWLALALAAAACGGESRHNPQNGDPSEPGVGDGGKGAVGGSGTGTAGSVTAAAGSGSTTGGTAATGGTATTGGIAAQGGDTAEAAGAPSDPAAAGAGDGGSGGEAPPSCDPIVFDDPDFEFAVRRAVNKSAGALTSADVAGLTFVATGGVQSIRGAECLTDLTEFDIGGLPFGKVTDLSPLAPLKKLETIDVGRNPLASVAPLGSLPKLKQLFMSTVPTVLDLTPLASAPSLELLYMQHDTIVDLAPLGSVKTLVTLSMRQATVLKPAGAAALKSVVDFDATGVFDDVTPLAALTQLQKLRIGLKPTQGFGALATLTNLIFIEAQRAGISDLTPLASMTKLRQFSVAGNEVSDLTPLQGLRQLSYVVLVDNEVQDLSPLAKNPSLANGDSLFLQQNPFVCAAQAANLADLQGRGVDVFSDCQ